MSFWSIKRIKEGHLHDKMMTVLSTKPKSCYQEFNRYIINKRRLYNWINISVRRWHMVGKVNNTACKLKVQI